MFPLGIESNCHQVTFVGSGQDMNSLHSSSALSSRGLPSRGRNVVEMLTGMVALPDPSKPKQNKRNNFVLVVVVDQKVKPETKQAL